MILYIYIYTYRHNQNCKKKTVNAERFINTSIKIRLFEREAKGNKVALKNGEREGECGGATFKTFPWLSTR